MNDDLKLPERRKRRGGRALSGQIGESFDPIVPGQPVSSPRTDTQKSFLPERKNQPSHGSADPQSYARQLAQPVVKPPRKKRPVTTGKLAINLPYSTMKRLENTFGHMYITGQMSRKSHLIDQAILELCERLEIEQNGGEPFPETPLTSAPAGAPRKRVLE